MITLTCPASGMSNVRMTRFPPLEKEIEMSHAVHEEMDRVRKRSVLLDGRKIITHLLLNKIDVGVLQ